MEYIGEHLMPGKMGHLLIIISFVTSLFAAGAYLLSFRSGENLAKQLSWKKLARIFFFIDVVAFLAIFIILYSLIANHRYEYFYVYKNSGNDLEPKYIFSSLWSASEGSFILWAVWHAIIGMILIFTSKKWEAPVMMVLSLMQACLSTMLLGVYVAGVKIGSNPFVLFREQMPDLPIFTYADYVSKIADGNGLNQLLQNYWMVIHPPVLFIGFASVIVPFAFAIAGLMTKKLGEWTKPALPWALFSAAILGVGVMMGAAWAYESLSFGGYWAWDPVENAVLVPWMVLVAGIHTVVIYKNTGRSLNSSFLLILLSFILIIYSTFLTRSGILGETSVHSFADLGMNAQLYLFLYVFFWLPLFVLVNGIKKKLIVFGISIAFLILANFVHPLFTVIAPLLAIVGFMWQLQMVVPSHKNEEEGSSREFWMFIGSIVLFFSSLFIIAQTSLPVYNKIFGTKYAPAEDVEFSYNRIQIFIAIIIGLLTAVGQYFKYKKTGKKYFLKKIWIPALISFVFSTLIIVWGDINYNKYGIGFLASIWIAVACSIFTVVANFSYIWIGIKGSLKLSGPSVAHFGFGLMLFGILISSSKKEILSYNTSGISINFGPDSKENTGENLTLVKGVRMDMGKYWVTYHSDSIHPKKSQWYYHIKFESKDGKENFTITPDAFVNYQGNEGLMANPDAKHYWNRDIFGYITAMADPERNSDTASFEKNVVKIGDSIFYSRGYIILEDIVTNDNLPVEIFGHNGKLFEAKLKVVATSGSHFTSIPRLAIAKEIALAVPDTVMSESLVFQLNKVEGATAEIGVKESNAVLQYITLKVYKFPFINVLWLGTIFMAVGFCISMIRRVRLNK